MKYTKIIIALGLSLPLIANDAAYNRGETLFFEKGCSSCHGPDAEGSSMYPKLANRSKVTLKNKLKRFRAGKTTTSSQQMMAQFAQTLSDKDIDDLTTFLANHRKKATEDVSDDLLGGFGS